MKRQILIESRCTFAAVLKSLVSFWMFVLLMLLTSTTIYAQADSVNLMVSSGQTGEIPRSESFHNIQIITASEIDQFNFQTISEVLQYSLNNFSVYSGKEGYNLNYAGTGRKNVRILLNGLPLYQTSIDNFDLSKIALIDVERIEILTGSMGVFYGPNAVFATVNIISAEHTRKVLHVRTNINTTSNGDINAIAKGTVNVGRHTIGLGVGQYFFSGVGGTDSFRVSQWKPRLRTQTELNYTYRILNDLNAFFSATHINSRTQDRGYPVANTLRAYDVDQRVNQSIFHGGIFGKISKYHTIDFSHSFTRYDYNNDKTVKILSDLTVFQNNDRTAFDRLKYDEYYNHFKISKISAKHKLNYDAGLEFSHQRDKERSILSTVKTNITQLSVLGKADYKTSENLKFRAGFRYTNSNKFKTKPIMELGLKYKMSETANFIANYSKGYRTPTFNEMFYTFENPELNITGNLKLQSESFNRFSTTLRIKSDKVLFFTNLYWVNSNNGIQLSLIDPDMQLYQFVNVRSAKLLGQNINIVHQGESLRLEFSASNNGINQYPEEIGSYYFSQELLFKTIYRIASTNTTIGFVSKYQGEQREIRENAFGVIEDFKQNGFWLVDFSIRQQLFDKPIYAHIGVKNITNTLNVGGSYLALDRISNENINNRIPISIDYGRRIWFSIITGF
ncbi:MAG: outer membrane cobalamin receptor [Bacteroidia bacterium]